MGQFRLGLKVGAGTTRSPTPGGLRGPTAPHRS